MIVIEKYGGSVLKSVDDIISIGNKIIDDYDRNNKYIIVLSAIKNKTNELIEDINKVSPNINKYYSKYITLGEIQSSILLSSYLDKYFNVAYLDPVKKLPTRIRYEYELDENGNPVKDAKGKKIKYRRRSFSIYLVVYFLLIGGEHIVKNR